jgi:hypothetical protein
MSFRYSRILKMFLILPVVCAFCGLTCLAHANAYIPGSNPSTRHHAQDRIFARENYRGAGLLIVARGADFGTGLFLEVKIDGREVAHVPPGVEAFEPL